METGQLKKKLKSRKERRREGGRHIFRSFMQLENPGSGKKLHS